MLKSYLKVAIRNLIRNRTYSLINILGLSLGIACCLLLSLYIQDEFSYDQHHKNLGQLYRIITEFKSDRGFDKMSTTSPPITMTMKEEIAGIKSATRVINPPGVAQNLIKYEDKLFYEPNGLIADSTLFDVLTYDFLEGNPSRSLVHPNSVVISERMAKKLFGNESALDKSISISQGGAASIYKITGVFKEDFKTHVNANFFISMTSDSGIANYIRTSPDAAGEWAGQNFIPGYVMLQEGASRDAVIKQMNEVLVKYGSEDMKAMGLTKTLSLEPVQDIYLRSDIGRSPRIIYTYVIASIAAFILLIACINFMNLSTAKATKRAAEIGVRKVMGAFRGALVAQILGEAMVIVVLSIIVGVVLLQAALPSFNQLTGKVLSFGTQNMFYLLGALAGIAVITGLLAGSYPAFYLSSFKPVQVLKGKGALGNSSGWLRRSLVVFQFTIAIVLGCGMVITYQQLNYMQAQDLGFDANAKIVLPLRTSAASQSYPSLRKELEQYSGVEAVSAVQYAPGSTIWSDMAFYTEGGNMDKAILIRRNTVDDHYFEMMNMKLIAGRTFTDNRAMDSQNKVILNRKSCEKFGIEPEKMVGQKIYFEWQGELYTYEVIGVMENYHQNSLKEEINPTLFDMASDPTQFANIMISVNTDNFKETLASLETTWNKIVADTPFEFAFLDDNLEKLYQEDQKVSQIITSFTLIALMICCLGLYGLSTYMAERRTKEIGVRKVLGASVKQIVGMMNMEFVKLVAVAFALAVPLAWYGMDKWLSGFAYKVSIGLSVFVYAGLSALVIAILTVSYESIKAASVNPANSLRSE